MIFKPELARLIMQGRKTMTRRRAGVEKDCRYKVGRSYAVQPGRGRRAIGRVTITGVREERLGDMPIPDAKREGFATRDEFFAYWEGLYGGVDRDLRVWVISFALGDHTDLPRLLAVRAGGPHGDYTANPYLAMRDEGEAVSGAEQARFSELGTAGWRDQQLVRLAQLERLPLPERARRVEMAHAAGLMNASSHLRVIRQRLEKLKNAS